MDVAFACSTSPAEQRLEFGCGIGPLAAWPLLAPQPRPGTKGQSCYRAGSASSWCWICSRDYVSYSLRCESCSSYETPSQSMFIPKCSPFSFRDKGSESAEKLSCRSDRFISFERSHLYFFVGSAWRRSVMSRLDSHVHPSSTTMLKLHVLAFVGT